VVAVIRVGAVTETEMKKKLRLEDALMQPEQQLKKVLFQEEAQLWLIYQRMSLRGQKII
jgi:hypothetical protein